MGHSYIQNHSMVRTRGIFRTLSNICDGTFCKNSYLAHFSAQPQKIKKSTPRKFLIFSQKKAVLIFQETDSPPPKLFFYISSKELIFFRKTKKFFIFQELELSCIQKPSIMEFFLYFGKDIFRHS